MKSKDTTCYVCDKTYKTLNKLYQHLESRQHIDKYKQLTDNIWTAVKNRNELVAIQEFVRDYREKQLNGDLNGK